jgi:2-methylcitrate dehydratase PrpD
MYFGAAMAIIKRRAFIEEHTEDWLQSPQVQDLISKIYCHHDPELDNLLPEQFPARAVIQTVDGRTFETTYEIPHGDGMNPLSLDELRGKYQPLASSIYSQERVQEIENRIMNLEEISDFSTVAELLSNRGG